MWLGRLFTSVVLLSSLFYLLRSAASMILRRNTATLYSFGEEFEGYLLAFSVAWVFVIHFRLMFQTLGLSANAISRERQGGTWELLTLTSADASQIVLGKWWAVVKTMARPYLVLGVLRALVILWVAIATYGPFLYFGYAYTPVMVDETTPRLLGVLFTGVFIVVATLLNLGFTAACGLSASPGHSRASIALARAVGTRLGVIFLAVLIPAVVAFVLRTFLTFNGVVIAFVFALVTLVDNGLVTSMQLFSINLSAPSYQYYLSEQNDLVLGITLGIAIAVAVYVLLTWLMLRYATYSAVRQGALPSSAAKTPLLSGVPSNL